MECLPFCISIYLSGGLSTACKGGLPAVIQKLQRCLPDTYLHTFPTDKLMEDFLGLKGVKMYQNYWVEMLE